MTLLTDPVRSRTEKPAVSWRRWFSLSKAAAFTSILLITTAAIVRPDVIGLAFHGLLWVLALIVALYGALALVLGACVLAFGPSDD